MKASSRQRTKCFTGCWTCRSRRVKCDEAAPLCQRCRQFGVQCEGYGLRLSWVQYDPHDHESSHDETNAMLEHEHITPSRASRRAPGVSTIPLLSSPEIDVTLKQIDDWHLGEVNGIEHGGFSVFSMGLDDSGSRASISPAGTVVEVFGERDGSSQDGFQTLNVYEDEGLPQQRTADISYEQVSEQQAPPVAVLPVAQTLSKLRSESGYSSQTEAAQHGHHPSRHLDILSVPANQKRLIHHWVTFTSRKLVLLDEPHNPCRTMMLPMALRGLISSSDSSNSDVAIFHALCASSAYNLFELSGRTNEEDHELALYHDQQAIHHLRNNLARVEEHQDDSFAMAIMACIAVEAISGTTQRWRTHVSGGLAYLDRLQSRGLDEVVLAPFRCHMLSMAILCDVPFPADLKSLLNNDGLGSLGEGLEFTFPYYGVSRSFLLAQNRMNEYAATIAITSNKSAALEKELDAFELQLYLEFPGLPSQDRIASRNQMQGAIISHTAKTFYYAGLVFFQRSVRRASIDSVQSLVELGVAELESIERAGNGQSGCMMLWPVLVLGAESGTADIQKRVRIWFQSQQKLGFRNLVVLEELIVTVWKARVDSASGARGVGIDWRDIIMQTQFDVFRL